jgi:hypothetical protein
MYRELAAASPDRHRPNLALALDTLAEVLVALDRHAEASAACDESAKLREQFEP